MRLSHWIKGLLLLGCFSPLTQAAVYLCESDAGQLSSQLQACPAKPAPPDHSAAYAALDEAQLAWYQAQTECIDSLFYDGMHQVGDPERERLVSLRLQGTALPPYREEQFEAALAQRAKPPAYDQDAYFACYQQLSEHPEPSTRSNVTLRHRLRLDALRNPQGKPADFMGWTYSRESESMTLIASDAAQAFFSSGGSTFLHAVDLHSGQAQWTFASPGGLSGLVLGGGRVYLAEDAGHIQVLDQASGQALARFERPGTASDLKLVGDLLILIEDYAQLVALDRQSGAERWRVALDSYSSESLQSLQQRLYLMDDSNRLHAYASASGKALWQRPMGEGGRLLAGAQLYYLDHYAYQVQALATDSGAPLWTYAFGENDSPYLDPDAQMLYLAMGESNRLKAVDLHTRQTQWNSALPTTFTLGGLDVAGQTLFLSGYEGELLLLDRRDGRLEDSLHSEQPSPATFLRTDRYALLGGASSLLLFEL